MKNVAILNTCISGSTGKIAVGLYNTLKKSGYNVFFLYGREDGKVDTNYYRIGSSINKYIHAGIARFFGLQGFGSPLPTLRMLRFLTQNNIDTVYIISPHGYYINEKMLWDYIIEKNIKAIYLMIDEYAYLGNCGYSGTCRNYLNKCINCPRARFFSRLIQGASKVYKLKERVYPRCRELTFIGPEYTILQAKQSPLMNDKQMILLDEAIDTEFFTPKDTKRIRAELNISQDQIVCVCVAPYSYERKGCKFFLELARRFEKDDAYKFVHVGFNVDPKSVDMPSNYIPIGFVNDQEKLALYYSLGDLFVFPSLMDTMPNACLEALSSGTPLLLFDVSGMPYIADETVASFVEVGNVNHMEEVVRKTKIKNQETIDRCREYALRRYDNRKYFEKLIRIGKGENKNDSF